ncbi:unnamed protein product (macronuclear) [Paramecium tetraurelia]|uniref:RING-type E3 ubiquitin transferase n=1 Tax=Paramecium tetraurelia TaxID=5888 RepID=A0C9B6_PARTE|nr:uncharacterized protein GSPATT00006689001 [Paramecium tetraurelia]CAK67383.1 unnamed protein product [Paramecium tetraurelia]|eukprot:XP_001434780.1 hypothetical protein (macronuclear) [Paramecium tetraurelia strain d4-2]
MNRELEETSQNQENKISKEEEEKKFKLLKQHFRGQFKESYKYIGKQYPQDFGKYLVCFYSLQQRDQQCEVNPLFVWLTIVGMYEFFNSIRYLAVLYSLQMNSKDIFLLVMAEMLTKDSNEQMNLQGMEERNKRNQIKTLIKMKLSTRDIRQEELIAEPPFTQCEIIHQAEALNKYTRLMKVYNQFIFYLIFTGGNIAYFQSDSNDCDDSLNNVTFVLLLIGYLFSAFLIIGFGLAIISMALYMPIILFLFIFKSVCKIIMRLQTKSKFKKMNKFQYRCCPELSSIQQCNICMCDYEDNDLIVQLPCSTRHHFHDHCLQQWVIIKQQCPVCRKLI